MGSNHHQPECYSNVIFSCHYRQRFLWSCGACRLVFQDSRDDTNWYEFMLPETSMFIREAVSMVGRKRAGMVLQNASDPTTLTNIQAAPQAISLAIGFSELNLRPLYPYTSIPAINIGLICRYHILHDSWITSWHVQYFHYRQILLSYRSSRSLFISQSICSTSTPKAICLLNFGS